MCIRDRATVTAVVWVPSTALSSMPVAVTVCAVFQLLDVNVNWAGDTVASPVSAETTDRTTFEDGWAFNTTVNESVDPASDTAVDPPDNATVTPAPVTRLPEESNFHTNASVPPFKFDSAVPAPINSRVPAPGSKSTAP